MFSVIQHFIAWVPLGLPAFLFLITTIVFFHELGHFMAARAFGIRVETFSIGFGPAIVSWTDKRGTLWKISWVPLGGFVKFFGDLDAASVPDREHVKSLPDDQRKYAFPLRPVYQRAIVVAAGPIANFILAIAIFFGVFFSVGAGNQLTYVGAVSAHDPAGLAGVKTGDKILAVNARTVETFDDLRIAIRAAKGKTLSLAILRGDSRLTLRVTPKTIQTKDIYGDTVEITGIGIAPSSDERNIIYQRISAPEALNAAFGKTWEIADTSLTYLGRMVTGRSDTSQLSGPVGVAGAARDMAARGFTYLIFMAGVVSVSIGLINLFPIPVLDGGHLLYYACEAALGRPLGERAQDVGFRLGLAVVLGLFLLATWNDLVRPNLF